MSWNCLPLLAEEGVVRTTFEWGRIQSNADWVLPIAVCLALMLFVRAMYRRDAVELRPVVGWLLTVLRTAAFLALLVLYLEPQWRTEREVVRNSRTLLLVDTSLSMGLTDADAAAGGAPSSRAARVASALEQTDFVQQLRKTHDVVILRFDEELARLGSRDKLSPGKANDSGQDVTNDSGQPAADEASAAQDSSASAALQGKIDWARWLKPAGRETRLGQALRQLINDERNAPVAGVVLITDGGQNSGLSPETAVDAAREAKIPVFTVGVGSHEQPANVRVYRLEAPPRAHPGDPYSVVGMLQAQHMAGEPVTVQLFERPAARGPGKADPGPGRMVRSEQVILGGDGEVVPVKFEVSTSEVGRYSLTLVVQAPAKDRNARDNQQEADIEVVDRRTRVLLFAGGPGRDYQFLRNQLFRDKSATVDVLLQTGKSGMSQDAAKILDQFPGTREELYAYDCIVAFDPDWQALNAAQIELLDRWVGEQGGGLIVVAGPVHAGETVSGWVQNPAMAKIVSLYPVEFNRRASAVDVVAATSNEPAALNFTREGVEAEFLWLADNATASQRAWAGLGGVYSCFPVRGPKPGATVYAHADSRAAQFDKSPVYFAGQYFGSGQSFYIGSAEMWRLRRADPAYFEQFFTRLIRHVSQGRLLRQSSRGVLMVGKDRYLLGNTVEIRAQLTNAQLNPLEQPSVPVQVLSPTGSAQTIALRPEPGRAGMYAGQVTATEEGTYRLELAVPQSEDERLTRRIQVSLPDLERENPQRNDKLLTRIAEGTEGQYYAALEAALAADQPDSLLTRLKDHSRTIILPETPNPLWEREWLTWLLAAVCSLLCLEWLIRRLSKLA